MTETTNALDLSTGSDRGLHQHGGCRAAEQLCQWI